MNPEYTLKFKLYWEVRNPLTIKSKCLSCDGTGQKDNWDDFPYVSFEDCLICNGTGYIEKVDPDQYPQIDPNLQQAIQNLINSWSK